MDKNRAYAQVLAEYVDGEVAVSYVYGLDLIYQERNEKITIYLVDGLGSTRVLTDISGNVVNEYDYEAFGGLIDSSGDTDNSYLFAGEQFDGDLDEYYLRQRYYDQGIGRFTRRDTYEGRINEPITLHKYLYANANPVVYVDPSGNVSVQQALIGLVVLNVLWGAINPFDIGGIDLIADDPLSNLGLSDSIRDIVNSLFDLHYAPFLGIIWSHNRRLTSPQNALKHWNKHKADFPHLKNSVEFVKEAQKFVDNPPSTALVKTLNTGEVVIYDPVSDVFATKKMINGQFVPQTMFKPDINKHPYPTNEAYFHGQQ